MSHEGIACEGFSPLQPPGKKFGTIEHDTEARLGVVELSEAEESEVRSQVSSRYMENLQKNFQLGKAIAQEDARKREKSMQIGREINEFKNKILDRANSIQSDKYAVEKVELR